MLSSATSAEFLEYFAVIQCPYTSDVDPTYLGELLLQPSPYRMRLLTWLLSSIDDDVEKAIESHRKVHGNYASNFEGDGLIYLLANIASTLLLCSQDNVELIRGNCPQKQHIEFWRKLLIISKHASTPDTESKTNNIIAMLEHMLKKFDLSSMIQDACSILPPTLFKELQISQKLIPKAKLASTMSPLDAENRLSDLKKVLDLKKEKLSQLKSTYEYADTKPDDRSLLNKLMCSLTLMCGDLEQLQTSFVQTFTNNLEPYCTRTAPKLGTLGTTIASFERQMEIYLQIMTDMKQVYDGHKIIVSLDLSTNKDPLVESELDCLKSAIAL